MLFTRPVQQAKALQLVVNRIRRVKVGLDCGDAKNS
jgi:hypothetical protein